MDKVKVSSIIDDLSSKYYFLERSNVSLKRDLISSIFRLFEDHSFVPLYNQKRYTSHFQDIWNCTFSLVKLERKTFENETRAAVFFLQENLEITRSNYSPGENIDYIVVQMLVQLKKLVLSDYDELQKTWDEELLVVIAAHVVILIYYLD